MYLPFQVKKLAESFVLTIPGLVEEVLLSTEDTQEMTIIFTTCYVRQ